MSATLLEADGGSPSLRRLERAVVDQAQARTWENACRRDAVLRVISARLMDPEGTAAALRELEREMRAVLDALAECMVANGVIVEVLGELPRTAEARSTLLAGRSRRWWQLAAEMDAAQDMVLCGVDVLLEGEPLWP